MDTRLRMATRTTWHYRSVSVAEVSAEMCI